MRLKKHFLYSLSLLLYSNTSYASDPTRYYDFFIMLALIPLVIFIAIKYIKFLTGNKTVQSNSVQLTKSSSDPDNFKSLSEFSKKKNIPEEKLIKMIRDGFYNGMLINNEWFIHEDEFK